MGSFATVKDLEARWRRLSSDETRRAQALLEDASDLIRTLTPKWQDLGEGLLRRVTCQVARRAMLAADVGEVSSMQEQTGPFMTQVSYTNPQGDLYLTRLEKLQLDLIKHGAFEIDLLAGEDHAS
jgi:hypothetical protein|nr:MAG TPA: hypothetical protein [Caudoviricetes sp.]